MPRQYAAPKYHNHSVILHTITNPREWNNLALTKCREAIAAGHDGFAAVQEFLSENGLVTGDTRRASILSHVAAVLPFLLLKGSHDETR